MSLNWEIISSFISRINNSDSHSFESLIKQLFKYLEDESRENPEYLRYESGKEKCKSWLIKNKASGNFNWKIPDDNNEAKSLSYNLYKTMIEDNGISQLYYLFKRKIVFKDNSFDFEIRDFNNSFSRDFREALIDIFNAEPKKMKNAEPKKMKSETYKEKIIKNSKSVFVIQGRNTKINKSMFDFLRAIGLQPKEWTEIKLTLKEGSPKTWDILKRGFLEAVAFIVIMTPDDEAKVKDEFSKPDDDDFEKKLTPQPRLNVILETGIALAINEKNTIIVEFGKLRKMSDLVGIHTVKMIDVKSRKELADLLKSIGAETNHENKSDWLDTGDFSLS
jgi:predicted nucleotide-binding protein